jgi:hypothetical protein
MKIRLLSVGRFLLVLSFTSLGLFQVTGCSVISAVATSNRMEEARAANMGKQLVPKDGGTYLIPVGTETISYLGSGDTDWKLNSVTFTQPKGTYSILKVEPGTYTVYGNKRVLAGGEATWPVEVKKGEAVCFHVFNPVSGPARIEIYKNDACDPILRALKQVNVVDKL